MIRIASTHIAAGLAVCLCGCVSVTKVPTHETFVPSEAMHIMDEGPHTVAGQSFWRTVGGDVKTCAGFEVDLFPATAYAAERMRILYGSDTAGTNTASFVQKKPATTDPEYMRYARKTKCDADGKFAFNKVAPGSYYVVTFTTWSTGQAYALPEGGYQMRRVIAGPESDGLIISP
jgi:hypothetical protein